MTFAASQFNFVSCIAGDSFVFGFIMALIFNKIYGINNIYLYEATAVTGKQKRCSQGLR